MARKKQEQPAVRRFTFRHDPDETTAARPASEGVEYRPPLDQVATQAKTYIEQLAEAEKRAGRKVTKVSTRTVRVMGGQGISPSRLHRQVVVGRSLIRTFIFR